MKKLLFVLVVGVVQFISADGKRRVFFREVTPTTSDAIIRSQRGVIATGYQNKVVEQQAAANAALEEATQSAQAAQFLANSLQNSIKLRQQFGTSQQMAINPGAIRLVDQYGNEVNSQPQAHSSGTQTLQPSPVPNNAFVTQQLQPQVKQQLIYPYPQQYLPQPTYLQAQPQFIQTQPQPLLQQFVTPEGFIFHQVVEQPNPGPHHLGFHTFPQPVVQESLQYYHPQIPIAIQDASPPAVEKIIQPVVTKTVEVPTVKLVKQPILPPDIFQKEIFAVKNPPVRVLTYSDLCTVYPYQRKLSACVYKKAAIPELHHPDIQLVPAENKNAVEMSQRTVEEQLNPRTQPLRLSAPNSGVTSSSEGAGSIQDILGRGKKIAKSTTSESSEDSKTEDDEVSIADEENVNIAESSNKKEKLVIKTTKPKQISHTTSRPQRRKTNVLSEVKPRSISSTTKIPPSTIVTTRKPKKTKRRSRNSGSKRRSERNNRKSNTNSTSLTTEQQF